MGLFIFQCWILLWVFDFHLKLFNCDQTILAIPFFYSLSCTRPYYFFSWFFHCINKIVQNARSIHTIGVDIIKMVWLVFQLFLNMHMHMNVHPVMVRVNVPSIWLKLCAVSRNQSNRLPMDPSHEYARGIQHIHYTSHSIVGPCYFFYYVLFCSLFSSFYFIFIGIQYEQQQNEWQRHWTFLWIHNKTKMCA